MRMQVNSTKSGKYVTVYMTAPSPLAGEGITYSRSGYRRVRGTGGDIAMNSPSPVFASRSHPLPQGERERSLNTPSFLSLSPRAGRG